MTDYYDLLKEAITIRKTAMSVNESIMSEHIVYNVSLNDAPNWVRTLRQSLLAGVTEMDLKHVEEMMRKKWEKEKANMKKDFRKFAPTEPPTVFKEQIFSMNYRRWSMHVKGRLNLSWCPLLLQKLARRLAMK